MGDNDIMPFGIHKGKEMANVPDQYLKWFWDQNRYNWENGTGKLSRDARSVMKYIEDFGPENLS